MMHMDPAPATIANSPLERAATEAIGDKEDLSDGKRAKSDYSGSVGP